MVAFVVQLGDVKKAAFVVPARARQKINRRETELIRADIAPMATGSFLLFTHQCGHCDDHGNFSPFPIAKKTFFVYLN
jgi:hypothetical protein